MRAVTEIPRGWVKVAIVTAVVLGSLAVLINIVVGRAEPILRGRVVETLNARFGGRVELESLHVSVLRGLEVRGDRLRIYPPDGIAAAGAKAPLIAVRHFSFHSGIFGLFLR